LAMASTGVFAQSQALTCKTNSGETFIYVTDGFMCPMGSYRI
jgi:hypothetical protein